MNSTNQLVTAEEFLSEESLYVTLTSIEKEICAVDGPSWGVTAYNMPLSTGGIISLDTDYDEIFEYEGEDSQHILVHTCFSLGFADLQIAKYQMEACFKSEVPFICKMHKDDHGEWWVDFKMLLSKSALNKHTGRLRALFEDIVDKCQQTVPTIKREAFSDCLVICQQ